MLAYSGATGSSSSPPSSSSSSSLSSSASSPAPDVDYRGVPPVVFQIGHHYAFSFFDDAVEKHRVEYGQLSVFKEKQGCSMIETALMMNDAREIGVQIVCSWFDEDEATGILKLGMVHPDRYSSRCCIGDVDLELVDVEAKTLRFVDPSRRQELQFAHEQALPSAQGVGQEQLCRWRWWREEEGEGRVRGRGLGPRFSEVKRRPEARKARKAAALS